MSKTLLKSGLVVAALTLASTAAVAQDGRGYRGWFGWGGNQTPGIDREQADQARDINRGIRNGSLTGREAAELRAEQARIAEMERRAKADGMLTRDERQRIRGAQAEADRHIAQESNDRDRAGGYRGNGNGWGFRRWW